jgi:hypothetical protein
LLRSKIWAPRQWGLEFVERCLYLPTLVVQGSKLSGRRLIGIHDRRNEAVDRFGISDALRAVTDYPAAMLFLRNGRRGYNMPLQCRHNLHGQLQFVVA